MAFPVLTNPVAYSGQNTENDVPDVEDKNNQLPIWVHHPEPFKSDDRCEIEDPIQIETDMMYKVQSKEEEINTDDQTEKFS